MHILLISGPRLLEGECQGTAGSLKWPFCAYKSAGGIGEFGLPGGADFNKKGQVFISVKWLIDPSEVMS
jgi:hypothetical protein